MSDVELNREDLLHFCVVSIVHSAFNWPIISHYFIIHIHNIKLRVFTCHTTFQINVLFESKLRYVDRFNARLHCLYAVLQPTSVTSRRLVYCLSVFRVPWQDAAGDQAVSQRQRRLDDGCNNGKLAYYRIIVRLTSVAVLQISGFDNVLSSNHQTQD